MYKYGNLGDTFYFQMPVNDINGNGASGTLAHAKVRLSGDSVSAAPIYTAVPSYLSNVAYTAGCYEAAIPATIGNGFVANNDYGVFADISINSVNPLGLIGGFKLGPVLTNSSAPISQDQISSGVLQALNTVISSSAPSGSINEKMYNLISDIDLVGEILSATVSSYNTAHTVGKILNDLSSGNISSIIPTGSTNAPTVTQIRQEIDSNSTQLQTLTGRLTSNRAGYLDNLSSGIVAQSSDMNTLLSRLTLVRSGYLDNLSAGAIALNSDMSTLLGRLTSGRAGYLDNLSSGLVATQAIQNILNSKLDTINSLTSAIKVISDQINFTGTKINAYNTNDSSGVITLLNRIIGTITAGNHFPQSGDSFTVIQNIQTTASKLDTMLELNGSVYEFTTGALINSPTSTGGFTNQDRLNITTIEATTNILNTMIENVSGYRLTSKSLETIGNNITLANAKLDSSSGVINAVYNQTTNTGVKIPDVETGLSFIHAMQAIFALTCKMNGGGTTTINARNYLDTKNRITFLTDASNNRLTVNFNFD